MYLNVRDRAQEIGVLMAQGFCAGAVRLLVLSKATLQGVVGGAMGFALGAGAALSWENSWAAIASLEGAIAMQYFGMALAMSAVACLLGSWLPASVAVRTDPAEVLRSE
jgi:putative ABC transport system permease protein